MEISKLQKELRKEMDIERREIFAYRSKKVQGMSPQQIREQAMME